MHVYWLLIVFVVAAGFTHVSASVSCYWLNSFHVYEFSAAMLFLGCCFASVLYAGLLRGICTVSAFISHVIVLSIFHLWICL